MQVPQARTSDGFEVQIATNHLGPFTLTTLFARNLILTNMFVRIRS